eukprot:1026740-Amphidinium_carterae.4
MSCCLSSASSPLRPHVVKCRTPFSIVAIKSFFEGVVWVVILLLTSDFGSVVSGTGSSLVSVAVVGSGEVMIGSGGAGISS